MKSFEFFQTLNFKCDDEMMSIKILESIFNNILTFLEWTIFRVFSNLELCAI